LDVIAGRARNRGDVVEAGSGRPVPRVTPIRSRLEIARDRLSRFRVARQREQESVAMSRRHSDAPILIALRVCYG
jgi:hypothetical protein